MPRSFQSRLQQIRTPARPTFFPTFDKSHCDKCHSSFTKGLTVYVEKQPVAWKVCCVEFWCEKTMKLMNRWTGQHDMTEKLLKTAFRFMYVGMVWFEKCHIGEWMKIRRLYHLYAFMVKGHNNNSWELLHEHHFWVDCLGRVTLSCNPFPTYD